MAKGAPNATQATPSRPHGGCFRFLRRCGRAAAVVLAVASCSGGSDDAELAVEFAGCETVVDGPVCIVGDDASLAVWLRPPRGAALRFSDGRNWLQAADPVAAQGGSLYRLDVPPDASMLEVTVVSDAGNARWSLPLAREQQPPWVSEAGRLAAEGDTEGRRALLLSLTEADDTAQRAEAFALLGRLHLSQGEHEAARRALRNAMQESRRQGRRFDALRNGLVLAYSLAHGDKRLSEAREVLQHFGPGHGQAEWTYFLAYHSGDVAAEAGDARAALRAFGLAAEVAERFGWARRQLNAEQLLAVQLQQLGRRDDARRLLQGWSGRLPDDLPGCERGLFYNNVGWNELLALESGAAAEDALPPLRHALELLSAQCTEADIANAHVNLALAGIHAGDTRFATKHLAAARSVTAEPPLRLLLWSLDIEARIAIAERKFARAGELYAQLQRLAAATLSPTARWRAAIGQARLARTTGKLRAAIDAFGQAETILAEDLLRIPLTEGRESFVASREWATRAHIDTLLSIGETRGAYEMARRARQRLVRSLSPTEQLGPRHVEARRRWEQALVEYERIRSELNAEAALRWSLPADEIARAELAYGQHRDELRELLDVALSGVARAETDAALEPPADGSVIVVLQPLEHDWAVFVDDGDTVIAQRVACELPAMPRDTQADCLLQPVIDRLGVAGHVVLMPVGAANEVDLHTARAADREPLLATVAISYAADLPSRQPLAARGRALVVADPHGDLPGARNEARIVADALEAAGWTLASVTGEAGDATAVRALISGRGLFHYAGHATFGGTRGWDSELPLAEDTALTVDDILALPTAPALVVLSGCDTGANPGEPLPAAMNLANAFVASGATAVVATTRPVPDRVTTKLMQRFYRNWLQGYSLADALRLAQLEVMRTDTGTDWAAFRLLQRSAGDGGDGV